MATRIEVATFTELLERINKHHEPFIIFESLRVQTYGFDDRIKAHTYIVMGEQMGIIDDWDIVGYIDEFLENGNENT